jgi:hypothetical protein
VSAWRSIALCSSSVLCSARLEAATITGTITWSKAKPPEVVQVMRDRSVCGREGPILDPPIAIDDRRRVREAVVWLDDAKGGTYLPFREVLFDQRNCTFVPHVAATTRGSIIRFKSSDPVLHNVHVIDEKGVTLLNLAMPVMDQEVSYRPPVPAQLSIRCEAGHRWMKAHVKVFDHAFFAVSGEGGRYAMTLVTPGEHTIVAWHPDIGRVAKKIIVPSEPNAALSVDFDL